MRMRTRPEATDPDPRHPSPPLRLGISACVLGEPVRYNGGHCCHTFVVEELDRYVEWHALCPELAIGLGLPREPIRLVGTAAAPRLVGCRSGTDHTEAMRCWAARQAEVLAAADLDGFILKKDSPSCGLFRVKVYPEDAQAAQGGGAAMPERVGRGLFAEALTRRLPLLPVEEDGRLHDAELREHFIERAFLYARWRGVRDAGPSAASLVRFHTLSKLQLMSHSPQLTRELGRLVASAGALPDAELELLAARYEAMLGECMAVRATRGRRVNALQHMAGFVKARLDPAERAELAGLVDEYAAGIVPLIVPMTLLSHHLRHRGVADWVLEQSWLEPYPRDLGLRLAV